jgi:hypothetical protein
LADWTPDKSDWFRFLQFSSLSERGAARQLADEASKIFALRTCIAYV